MTAILTMREYVALWLFAVMGSLIVILYGLDWAWEQVEDYRHREMLWRNIEIQSARERHPSYQVPMFDQDA